MSISNNDLQSTTREILEHELCQCIAAVQDVDVEDDPPASSLHWESALFAVFDTHDGWSVASSHLYVGMGSYSGGKDAQKRM